MTLSLQYSTPLSLSMNRIATAVYLSCSVWIQYESPDGKQLEDLARVVFIGFKPLVLPRFFRYFRARCG